MMVDNRQRKCACLRVRVMEKGGQTPVKEIKRVRVREQRRRKDGERRKDCEKSERGGCSEVRFELKACMQL